MTDMVAFEVSDERLEELCSLTGLPLIRCNMCRTVMVKQVHPHFPILTCSKCILELDYKAAQKPRKKKFTESGNLPLWDGKL